MLPYIFFFSLVITGCSALEPSYGVQDGFLEYFAAVHPEKPFNCLCGNVSIMGHQVNDDYCDCPDGSDEPGTSACTNDRLEVNLPKKWKFRCKNIGFKQQEIPHNQINDGLCDCCDGSDEYSDIIACPNVCAETQEIEEKKRLENERVREAGMREKEKMMEQVRKNREDDKVQLENEIMELEELRKSIEEKSVKLVPFEEKERAEKRRLLDEYNAAREVWEEKRKKNQRNNLNARGNLTTDCIRWSPTKICDPEEESPLVDKGCDDIIYPFEAGFCECINKETDSKVAYDQECDHEPLQCSNVCENPEKDNKEMDDDRFDMDNGASFELPEARDLRLELKESREKVEKLSSSVEQIQNRLNRSINTGDVIRTFSNECFSLNTSTHTYEICPLKDAHQYDKGTTHGQCIGRWGRFGDNTYSLWSSTSDYTHMIFENGDRCWNGVTRMTDVYVICGPENKLVQVEEPSMCRYTMVFETPAVCE
ncbi:putative protein kinase C substrate protein, heavy chain [Trypanosoma cruzi]|uniref:Glucosidase 2 subunit beta n=1 Tax=Trypanosoma cruzi TaxID=5693 RepID=A0A2V2UVP4_TRYCR|nr:putative protein kinase C substrate protein, heavy chain [Trypanosoma cruzi]